MPFFACPLGFSPYCAVSFCSQLFPNYKCPSRTHPVLDWPPVQGIFLCFAL